MIRPDMRPPARTQLNALRARRLEIDTHQEAIIYMPEDCLSAARRGSQAKRASR
jgi:hypothetical protein